MKTSFKISHIVDNLSNEKKFTYWHNYPAWGLYRRYLKLMGNNRFN